MSRVPPPPLTSPAAGEAQRRAHARARRADAARLLPVLGAALFLAPDLPLAAVGGATGAWLAYLFAAWALLVGLAAWLARAHLRAEREGDDAGDGSGGGAAGPGR